MLIRIAAVVCFAAMLSGCGGVSSPSQNASDTFTGTVSSGGGIGPLHTFNVGKVGEFFVTITAISPDQNIFLGVVFGQPTGNTCGALQTNYAAHLNTQALGGQIEKGTWCVQVGDVGYVPAGTTSTYQLRVSHPQ